MQETKINGCKTGSYSRTAKKCRKCDKKEYCSYKKLEAEAYIIGVDMATGHDFTYIPPIGGTAVAAGITAQEAAEVLADAMQKVNVGLMTPNETRKIAGIKPLTDT